MPARKGSPHAASFPSPPYNTLAYRNNAPSNASQLLRTRRTWRRAHPLELGTRRTKRRTLRGSAARAQRAAPWIRWRIVRVQRSVVRLAIPLHACNAPSYASQLRCIRPQESHTHSEDLRQRATERRTRCNSVARFRRTVVLIRWAFPRVHRSVVRVALPLPASSRPAYAFSGASHTYNRASYASS